MRGWIKTDVRVDTAVSGYVVIDVRVDKLLGKYNGGRKVYIERRPVLRAASPHCSCAIVLKHRCVKSPRCSVANVLKHHCVKSPRCSAAYQVGFVSRE